MWLLALFLVADSSFHVAVAPAESLAVELTGAGDPVVLLPGLFGSAFGYRRIVPLLNQSGFATIVIEPLGVGASTRPKAADYSLHAQALRVAAALDTLGVRRAYVVAHAVGASIALRLALERPDLVQGIVSLEGGVAESATTAGFRRAMRFVPLIKLLGGVDIVRGKIRGYMRDASADPTWVTDEVLVGYTADAARDVNATLNAYRAMGRAREPAALAASLSTIGCPVNVLLGGAPHPSAPEPGEVALLTERLPFVAVDTIPGVGHFPHEEAPERVVEAVERIRMSAWLFGRWPES